MPMNRKDLVGGPGEVRTLDLMTASHARSQLRHRPPGVIRNLLFVTCARSAVNKAAVMRDGGIFPLSGVWYRSFAMGGRDRCLCLGARLHMISKFIFALMIFSSAFLLFQVQPMLAKIILPWFGGSAGVWIVCLVFFQIVLLLGYSYAHILVSRFHGRTPAQIHAGLLAASLLVLPILPRESWRPPTPTSPAFHILSLLTLTVGLPYFLLSATSPLLQAWYADKDTSASPYRFYAVSNMGSMLALVSYPILVEPWVATSSQARGWSWAYACVAMLCAIFALNSVRGQGISKGMESASSPAPGWVTKSLWIALAACGSALFISITHHITQNIAAIPLLWIIPLALYLVTFILCFEGRGWYRRDLFLRLLGVALGSMAYAVSPSFTGLPLKVAIPLYCSCLFVCCMF